MDSEQKNYEIGYLLSPLIPEEAVIKSVETLRGSIEKRKGFVEDAQNPKQIRLAYPVKKQDHAYFGAIQFRLNPSLLREVKEDFDKNQDILRHLILEWKKEPPKSNPLLRQALSKSANTDEQEHAAATASPDSAGQRETAKVDEQEIDKKLDEILGE